jgi:CheY-like chemotaxis protein
MTIRSAMLTRRAAGSDDCDAGLAPASRNLTGRAVGRPSAAPPAALQETFVASTVLAVDDSVTMRKVLEITFAGPDFRCVTANGADAALQKLKSDKPDLVIADVTLEGKNGYELCKAVKQASPETPVLILSSKHNPYDPAKGSSAQADDYMDKPFDTQQMIDKVKKLLASKGDKPKAAPLPTAPVAQRARTLTYSAATVGNNVPGATPQPAPAVAQQAPAARAPIAPVAGTPATGMPLQARPAAAPAPAPAPAPAAATPARAPAAAASAAVAAMAAPVNGQMAAKLAEIGLTPAQVDAVLALSREVVERVVWEVVPVLAETIIKEEIARLTK